MTTRSSTFDHQAPHSSGTITTVSGIPLLPPRPARFAPVTRRLILLRTVLPLVLWFTVAFALVFLTPGTWATAAGVSLVMPGGGFLFAGQPILFVVWLVLFALALVLWWGVSAVAAPWIVLLAGAVISALMTPSDNVSTWAVPVSFAVFAAALCTGALRQEIRYRRKLAAIPSVNEYLRTAEPPQQSTSRTQSSDLDSAMLGFLLDASLQPLDRFDGFDYGEQYHGGTCLRYQLTVMGSALAVAGANLLPNYPSLIGRAQQNVVSKQTDVRVWRYWRVENILGNFDANPDPIVRDNIMFSGFLLSHIGEFEASTGSTRFDQPGSLTFTWRDGRRFAYDHDSLAQVVAQNFRKSALGIFPCEPGWVFTVCNAMAAQGLAAHSIAHHSEVWAEIAPVWQQGVFDEMMTPDGSIRHIRSTLFGFTFNDGDGTGEYYTAGNHNFESAVPDLSRRGAMLRLRGVKERITALEELIGTDGDLDLKLAPQRERGTRLLSTLKEWVGVIAGAIAVGNDRVARAGLATFHRDCATGGTFPERPYTGGLMMLAALMSTVWGAPLSAADLVRRGYQAPSGPILRNAPWPEILVSRAFCDNGLTLELVVEPHNASPGEMHTLEFESLQDEPYRLLGVGVNLLLEPDPLGVAKAEIPVHGRMRLTLTPAGR